MICARAQQNSFQREVIEIAKKRFKKTYFEICGLLAGASTDPPALAFATKLAGNDIPSVTYATVYPLTMILRIVAAQLLILLFS